MCHANYGLIGKESMMTGTWKIECEEQCNKGGKNLSQTEKVHESNLMDLISDTKQVSEMKDVSHEHLSYRKKRYKVHL